MNMFATHNSVGRRRGRRFLGLTLLAVIGCGEGTDWAAAPTAAPDRPRLVAHAQNRYETAWGRFQNEPTNSSAAWEYARAAFDRAEFSTNDTERAALAVPAIEACRKLTAREPQCAPAHYYLGMNLGQYARTKLLGALKLVGEMERAFQTAAILDERFDHAGPQRNLGLLYYEAPVIGSVGSRTKARKHLERAAELAPDYPENRLNLAEAYLKWRDRQPLKRELDALQKLWPAAKTNFIGPDWDAAWQDWTRREKQLRHKSAALLGP